MFWWSVTKRPTAQRHLALIKSYRPRGPEVSISSSFCLAAGRANLRAWCSFIPQMFILFHRCARINHHSCLTANNMPSIFSALSLALTHLSESIHVQGNHFCSEFLQNTFSSIYLYERTTPWNSHAIFSCR